MYKKVGKVSNLPIKSIVKMSIKIYNIIGKRTKKYRCIDDAEKKN